MSHYVESEFCRKLWNRLAIPKSNLKAYSSGSTKRTKLEKKVFSIYYWWGISLYMLFPLIPNFSFWYFFVLKWVLIFFHHIREVIRLFNSKRNKFWHIKPYIFGKYSLRAFQQYVALSWKWVLSEVTKQTRYSKK